jgi:hypothetical protein
MTSMFMWVNAKCAHQVPSPSGRKGTALGRLRTLGERLGGDAGSARRANRFRFYSQWRATNGSIRVARRAGMYAATSPVTNNTVTAPTIVARSSSVNPNNIDETSRDVAHAAGRPNKVPRAST